MKIFFIRIGISMIIFYICGYGLVMLKNVWTRKLDIQRTFPNPFGFIHFKSEPTLEPVLTPAIGVGKSPQDLEEKQQKIRNVKIQINRIFEDVDGWLQKLKEDDKENIRKINQDYYTRGSQGRPIKPHIERVNNFIKSINDYIRTMDRKIEDILISMGEEKFENVDWLKDEYQKYLKFVKICEDIKKEIKQKNDEKFSAEPTLNIIKGQNPYIE